MTLFADLPADEGLKGPERRLAMIAVMTTTAMAVLDGTIVNIALPSIGRALNVSSAATIWVVNGYLLAGAMTVMIFAAMAVRTGFRRLFVGGVTVFTLASLGCALSPTLGVLTLMRMLQGAGSAAMLVVGPAIYRTVFPTRLLGRVLGLNALLVAVNTAIAPTLGGALLAVLSWQWLFAINVPVGILALVLSLRAVPDTRVSPRGRFDIAGGVLSAVSMGALIMAADACSRFGGGEGTRHAEYRVGGYALLALGSGAAFIWRQKRADDPLLPLVLFASSRFSLAALTSLASFAAQGTALVALPFMLQNAYGFSALKAALLITAWPMGIVLAAPRAGRLADRYSSGMLSTVGLCLFTVGLAALALLSEHAQGWDIVWRGFVCGVGFGFFQSPNNREILSNAVPERVGNAAGVLAIVRIFGQCLGASVVGIILSLFTAQAEAGGQTLISAVQEVHATRLAFWIAAAAALLAAIASANRMNRSRS
jgi:DHA2 family multidrug resistance protein-like MFS transporter